MPFEISHKILNPYATKYTFYEMLKIWRIMIYNSYGIWCLSEPYVLLYQLWNIFEKHQCLLPGERYMWMILLRYTSCRGKWWHISNMVLSHVIPMQWALLFYIYDVSQYFECYVFTEVTVWVFMCVGCYWGINFCTLIRVEQPCNIFVS